ncbi:MULTISPECIES: bifunctional adenosylcobinamide kinase/adenosylcobinamide-phosphate guanylyltransferase [Paenibacillus]|uniref:bifunctional adenosylcobinamide kinase/adenosylcobinamide-phosphate guanylyltransferase n=1 Tax=Paenibacillus TaxID=44249 RepID=UPI0022B8CD69|nr:bifunctional adenosylcobinamide kinase/adenosylcobinamide-phosphate guanylyltransferase [Paenibacillus caseinilyticus]MCZ8519381.1 bifunctional adenosylcobinamide kinase/adenosylcobinamide-phosphate guanylyltransferase [Paenibacillus caseinilyticus]
MSGAGEALRPLRVLVTGGARSGKSGFAERHAARLGGSGLYIATSQAYDDEMRERIALHRRSREEQAFPWTTVEEPYKLSERLAEADQPVVLVDCLTLWLSNWLLRNESEPQSQRLLEEKIEELAQVFERVDRPVILVTNEVGYGLVPEYKLGRIFRDLSGRMNQRLARAADEVFLVTAGIPLELKALAYRE